MDDIIRLLIVVFSILAVISFKNRKRLQAILVAPPQLRAHLIDQSLASSLTESTLSLGVSAFFATVLVGLAVYRIAAA